MCVMSLGMCTWEQVSIGPEEEARSAEAAVTGQAAVHRPPWVLGTHLQEQHRLLTTELSLQPLITFYYLNQFYLRKSIQAQDTELQQAASLQAAKRLWGPDPFFETPEPAHWWPLLSSESSCKAHRRLSPRSRPTASALLPTLPGPWQRASPDSIACSSRRERENTRYFI